MVTNNRNLRSEIDTFLFLASLTNTSDYIQGINCASYPNLFDGEPLVPTSPNTTVIGSYEAASQVSNVALFMDTTSYPFLNQMNLTSIENPAYTEPFRAFPFPWAPLMMTFDYFAAMITNPRNLGVTFSITFNNGVMITGVNQVKYTNRSTEFPSFACSLGVENEKALGKLFSEIKVTPNSKVIMIDTLTGSLVANAEPKSIFKILPRLHRTQLLWSTLT
ncbi:hypothetical protein BC829DRAFT_240304 [Chytridium lagenaria]|nr:hypothetical protein BC829DRAFT_240304 [Chytridium lagenaria]